MGMSASQARLIALTARMSDTEYECQQINQQRVTLSNQMNAVYAAMMDMEVPVPPSKIDFKQKYYTGKNGDSNYTVKPGANGVMEAYEERMGDIVQSNDTRGRVSTTGNPSQFVKTDHEYTNADFKTYDITKATKYVDITFKAGTLQIDTGNEDDDGNNIFENVKTDLVINNVAASEAGSYKGEFTYNSVTYRASADPEVATSHYTSTEFEGELSEEEIQEHNNFVKELSSKTFVIENSDGTYDLVKASDIKDGDKVYECTDSKQFTVAREAEKNGENFITVGGCKTTSISNAEEEFGTDKNASKAWEAALNGLKHSKPDTWQDYTVIIDQDKDGNYLFSFCETSDLEADAKGKGDGYTITWTPGKGKYNEKVENFEPGSVVYNGTGAESAIINGVTVSLGVETGFDEDGYELAMQKYNNDKAQYDEEQNKLNKQTSIYQRQDKMLELKLTRLDSERNALNTEIEAVKKVIQDAIDRGFKTFSG